MRGFPPHRIGRRLALVTGFVLAVGAATGSHAQVAGETSSGHVGPSVREAQALEQAGELARALTAYDALLETAPESTRLLMLRGGVRFKLGRIEESLEDFDRVVEIDRSAAPYLWQRGISQYYAGRFEACRHQFEIHRTVNSADVENAAWHFLCVARLEGVDAARDALLPVGRDPRIPLMEIYELYAGRSSVEKVLATARSVSDRSSAAAGSGASPDGRAQAALFYAHLYIGLLAEAEADAERARKHIRHAVALEFPHYMGDMARVHLDSLEASNEQ